ncbi:MAG TPA: hypothetical protein VFN50_11235 [Acidimicrobiales bacterium]|nr:hypothetical protein [Acidimicrobiales bacterium]
MHFFALFLFFSLGVMAISMLGERMYRRVREIRPFLMGGWGVGLAWLANLNMWNGWSIGGLRYAWVGVTLTGLAIGGTALFVHALLGFFAGLNRKFDDQAEQMEKTELRRVA